MVWNDNDIFQVDFLPLPKQTIQEQLFFYLLASRLLNGSEKKKLHIMANIESMKYILHP